MKSGAKLFGLRQVQRTLRDVPEAITDDLKAFIRDAGPEIRDLARGNAPVDEGDLQASIDDQISANGLTVDIGSFEEPDEAHGAFVEFGTEDTPAQPWLYPAFKVGVRRFRRNVRGLLKGTGLRLRTRIKRDQRTRAPR